MPNEVMAKFKPRKNTKYKTNTKYKEGYFQSLSGKYNGTLPIIYRSSYEYKAFCLCERKPDIISWAAEPFIINWESKDGKTHRYSIDIVLKREDGMTVLVEVKPLAFTQRGNPKSVDVLLKAAAAKRYAEKETMAGRPTKFEFWTEVMLG